MPANMESYQDSEGLDRIPDDILLIIFNRIEDVKTLTRCRLISKRINMLISQTENILVRVDGVVSSRTRSNFLIQTFKSLVETFRNLISPKKSSTQMKSPSTILKSFNKIKNLVIELPEGDLKIEKGTRLKWKAMYGKTLTFCAILALRKIEKSEENDCDNGMNFYSDVPELKRRVVWTISSLIAASTRHFLVSNLAKKNADMNRILVRDRNEEGVLVVNEEAVKNFKEQKDEYPPWKTRTTVPDVKLKMRYGKMVEIDGKIWEVTLVTVIPQTGADIDVGFSDEFTTDTFGEEFRVILEEMLKRESYLLEMTSF